MKNSH